MPIVITTTVHFSNSSTDVVSTSADASADGAAPVAVSVGNATVTTTVVTTVPAAVAVATVVQNASLSVQASASPPDPPVLTAIAGDTVVDLSWTTPAEHGSAISGYWIYEDTFGPYPTYTTLPGITNLHVTGKPNGVTLAYFVRVNSDAGLGNPSNDVHPTPVGVVSSGLPADVANTLGCYQVVQWNDCTFEGSANLALWKTRGFSGFSAKMSNPNGGVGFPAGGNRFKGSSALPAPAPAPYTTQAYIEDSFHPGSVGATGWIGPHFPYKTGPFDWQYDGVPPPPVAGNPQTVGKNHAVQYMQEMAQFYAWQTLGFVGMSNDPEQVVGQQFYCNADSGQITPYMPAGTTPAAVLARIMVWWYDISRAVHLAWPNCKMAAYQWVPKHGYEWDNVYNSIPKSVQQYYEYWVKHAMWVAWAQGMADTPNLGPNAQLICGNAWFYKNFNSGHAKNHTQGALAEFSNSQHKTAGVNDFTDAQWNKIGDKIKFSTFIWPFTDMSVTAPVTGTVDTATNIFNVAGWYQHPTASKRFCVVLNPTPFGLQLDKDYWLNNTGFVDANHFTLHDGLNGPVMDIKGTGVLPVTIQSFRYHTSYRHTGEPAFGNQAMAARKYSHGQYRFQYGHAGGEETNLYNRPNDQALTGAQWTDVWRAYGGAPDDAHNWYLIDLPDHPTWGAVPGGHIPGMRAAAALNSSGVFVPTDYIDTTVPTIKHLDTGVAATTGDVTSNPGLKLTNIGGGKWRVQFRAAHSLGVGVPYGFNRTRNPSRTKGTTQYNASTTVAARMVWNKAGGTTNDVFPLAYQECTMDIAATSGERIDIMACSIHDQTHWVSTVIP